MRPAGSFEFGNVLERRFCFIFGGEFAATVDTSA